MKAADTSVVAAAFASWHPAHHAASLAFRPDVGVPEHTLMEAYSVLTRLPPPHRIAPVAAAHLLRERCTIILCPTKKSMAALASLAASVDISGGAIYDAVIAITARDTGAELVTRDRRAIRTYDLLGVAHTLVR